MILLFTSAREDRPYHMRDLLNVCCGPTGTEIQFGYVKKWVAENLKSGERLKGQDALIIFCERDPGGAKIFNYHPIRLAKITVVNCESDSLTIMLQLAGLFDYEKYASKIAQRMAEFEQYVLSSEDQPTPSAKTHHPSFVREDKDWDKNDFSGKWLPLVEYVGHLQGLKSCIFFRELETSLPGSKMPPLYSRKSTEAGKLQYSVEAGKSYRATYRLLFGEGAIQRPLEIVVSDKVASVGGPFMSQWSSGIEESFVLNFTSSFVSGISTLSVKVSPQIAGKIEAPEIQALLKVNVPWYVLPSAITLMTLGSLFISWQPEQVGNFILLTKGAGLFAMALGSYIGFRKLPFQAD
jgi:hypothetical protein